MALIELHLGADNSLADISGVMSVNSKSTRLFDVCNAVVDTIQTTRDVSTSAIDTEVFGLIESGAIPQVPKLKRGEIMEFIQKITFALSSTARLAILHELHGSTMMRATVAILEMSTGISEQTLRRHLSILINCRLLKRTRIGQTYLYESVPMRLATLTYLWNKLTEAKAPTRTRGTTPYDTFQTLPSGERVKAASPPWPDEQRHKFHAEISPSNGSAVNA